MFDLDLVRSRMRSWRHGRLEVFVADEVHGIWGTAIEIPGTARLNTNRWAR